MELAAMTAERILRSWEQALDAPPPRQAITILDCAGALSGVADPRASASASATRACCDCGH